MKADQATSGKDGKNKGKGKFPIRIRVSREYVGPIRLKINLHDLGDSGSVGHPLTKEQEDAVKRDWDLMRKIMLKIEETDDPLTMDFPGGYTGTQLDESMKRLTEYGMVRAKRIPVGSSQGAEWIIGGLTERGDDFLAVARLNNDWKRAKRHDLELLDFEALFRILQDYRLKDVGLKK